MKTIREILEDHLKTLVGTEIELYTFEYHVGFSGKVIKSASLSPIIGSKEIIPTSKCTFIIKSYEVIINTVEMYDDVIVEAYVTVEYDGRDVHIEIPSE